MRSSARWRSSRMPPARCLTTLGSSDGPGDTPPRAERWPNRRWWCSTMKRIVVGIESLLDATPVIEWVAQLATDLPVELVVVHVEPRISLLMVSSVQVNSDAYLR